MRVVAIERGHDGVQLREEGEEFEVASERLSDGSTWFVPVDQKPEPKPVARDVRPPGAGPKAGSKAPAISAE